MLLDLAVVTICLDDADILVDRVTGGPDFDGSQVRARLFTEPADDRHPAVGPLVIDQHFPAQVMIEMDLVPRLLQQLEAPHDGLHPPRTRMRRHESRRAIGGVVQKQDAGCWG